jgi:hypothetical protein
MTQFMSCDHQKIPVQVHISEKRTLPNSRIHRIAQSRFFHPRLSLGLGQIVIPVAVLKNPPAYAPALREQVQLLMHSMN